MIHRYRSKLFSKFPLFGLLLLGSGWCTSTVYAQCIATDQFPSTVTTPAANGSVTTITTANWAGEYSVVSLQAGETYAFTSSVATDFLTITTAEDSVLTFGITPVTVTAPSTGFYRRHLHRNDTCGTQNTSRTTTVQLILFCPLPTGLTASNLTTTSAQLQWNGSTNAISWQVEYGLAGFSLGTGTTLAAADTTLALTGLQPGTSYDFYVRSFCTDNDTSGWSGPSNFTTSCLPFTAPLSENFDTTPNFGVPDCWTGIAIGTNTFVRVRVVTNTSPHSPPNHLEMYNSTTAGAAQHLMFVSPPLADLSAGTNQLRFQAKSGTIPEVLIVGTMSDPGDPATFTPLDTLTTLNNAYQEFELSFADYSGTDQHIAFRHGNSTQTRYIYLDDIFWEALPTCPRPTDLTVGNFGTNLVTLGWTPGGSETQWVVEYGAAGFAPGTGTSVVANSNPFVLTGLTAGTTYDYYLRAICGAGDTSLYAGPVNFTTECLTVSSLSEDFENVTVPNLPNCWSAIVVSTSSAQLRTVTTFGPNSGTRHVEMFNSPVFGATSDLILVSPPIVNTDFGTQQLRFSAKWRTNNEILIIGTMDDPTDPSSFLPFDTINTLTNEYQEFDVSFADYDEGNEYVAFRHGNSGASRSIYLDDIFWEPIPNCLRPTNLTASNPTTDAITLNWAAGSDETQWVVEYGAPGFAAGTGTSIVADSVPFVLTGLTAATNYAYFVRAICSPGDTSLYAGPVSFATSCVSVSDFEEGFEGVGVTELPLCWSRIVISNSSLAAVQVAATFVPNNGVRHLEMYNSPTVGATSELILVSPVIDNLDEGTHQLRLSAKLRTNAEILIVGTISNPTDPATFTPRDTINTLTAAYQEFIVSFADYGGTDQHIAFRHGNSGVTRYVYIDDIFWEEIPACPTPQGLLASDVTTTGATLSWDSVASAQSYLVEYRVGTTGPWTEVITNNASVTLTGLQTATAYQARVSSLCGESEESDPSVAISFSTLCVLPVITTFPYTENFDGVTAPVLPCGWTIQNLNNDDATWATLVTSAAQSGSNALSIRWNSSIPMNDWVYTPEIVLQADSAYVVRFSYRAQSASFVEQMKVHIGDSADVTAMTTLLGDLGGFSNTTYSVAEFIYVPTTTGSYYVGLHGYSATNQFRILVDDFVIEAAPSCPVPIGLGASNVTATTANLSWTAMPGALSYGLEYRAGTTGPWTEVLTANSSQLLTDLSPLTNYQTRVRSVCSEGEESDASAIFVFSTPCAPPVIAAFPYAENFDNVTAPALPCGWTVENLNDDGFTWATIAANAQSSPNALAIRWNATQVMNDWVYTPELTLTAGITYLIRFGYRSQSATFNERLKVHIGDSATVTAMTTLLGDLGSFNNTTYQLAEFAFTPTATGSYFVGLHGYSIANQLRLLVDDFEVALAPVPECTAPNDLAAGNVTSVSANLSWTAPVLAESYVLEFRAGTEGPWTEVLTANTSAPLTDLLPGTTYQARIKSICSDSTESDFSATVTFTTLACDIPANLAASGVTATTAILNWTVSPSAQSYVVEFRAGTAGPWTEVPTANTSATLTGLQPTTAYQARVKAVCSDSTESNFSAVVTFITLALPPCNAPTGLATGDITPTTADLSWTASASAQSYVLEFRAGTAGPWTEVLTADTDVTLTDLLPVTLYQARVKSVCNDSTESDFSATVTFTTLAEPIVCEAPTGLAAGGITPTTVDLSWTAGAGADSYEVEFRAGTDGPWSAETTTETVLTLTDLLPETAYQTRVRSLCNDTLASEFSDALSFSTLVSSLGRPATYRLDTYPNPARTELHVSGWLGGAAVDLTLHDALGRAVRHRVVQGTRTTLAVGDLPAGLYHLTVRTATGTYTAKVVIER